MEVQKISWSQHQKWHLQDEKRQPSECYAMSSHRYVKEAIRIVESHIPKHDLNYSYSRRHGSNTPFNNSSYRSELYYTKFCNDELSSLYLNLIEMLRWMCEIGRLDILHETALLSQYMAAPRLGHLHQALNIFSNTLRRSINVHG